MKIRAAFTLIELLIVTTIIVILCGIAVPHFFVPEDYVVQQELDRISTLLVYLQQRAMARHEVQELCFLPHQNCYAYDKNQKRVTFQLATDLCYGALPDVLGPPGDPTSPITKPSSFPQRDDGTFFVRLFPNGKISAGAIYVRHKRNTIMGALTCTVSQVSYIRRYLYQAGQWRLRHTSAM
jgi:prepilin-type N-terminal cleavage/methylation domain-containing protein